MPSQAGLRLGEVASGMIVQSLSSRIRLTARTHLMAGSSNGTDAAPTATGREPA